MVVDLSEDEVDYDYDAASLARTGGNQPFARRFRSSEVARGGGRGRPRGKKRSALPQTEGSSDMQHQPRHNRTPSDISDDSIAQQERVRASCAGIERGAGWEELVSA